MLLKNDKGVYLFEKFPPAESVVHGFSMRDFGSMKSTDSTVSESRAKFAQALGIDPQKIVTMEQVHGHDVTWVTQKDAGTQLPKTDSLLTNEQQLFLSVVSADCLPILLYDKTKKNLGVVHAGWKGIFYEVISEAVKAMIEKGSDPKDILAGIGPCVRSCCYDITEERKKLFVEKFSKWNGFINEKEGQIYLDLPILAIYQLQALGIPEENIEDGQICTAENTNEFYSYRKEGDNAGRFMGIIGRA